MRLNAKGQVTIPADLRARHGLRPGDEVEVVDEGGVLQIVRKERVDTAGRRLVDRMRGRATTKMSTDELMSMFGGE